jgi:hypothetical protein
LDHQAAFTRYSWNAILAAHAFSEAPRLAAIPVHQDLTRRAYLRSRSHGVERGAQSLHQGFP